VTKTSNPNAKNASDTIIKFVYTPSLNPPKTPLMDKIQASKQTIHRMSRLTLAILS